ncbi:MAG: hypothetical protein WJ306_08780 [Ferrovum myxofaciens]
MLGIQNIGWCGHPCLMGRPNQAQSFFICVQYALDRGNFRFRRGYLDRLCDYIGGQFHIQGVELAMLIGGQCLLTFYAAFSSAKKIRTPTQEWTDFIVTEGRNHKI